MPAQRRGKGEEQRGVHSEWDVAFSPALVMIAEKSHFTTRCRVCETASVWAHPEQSSEEALTLKLKPSGSRTHLHKAGVNKVKTSWPGGEGEDKRWQQMLLWLLMAYWFKMKMQPAWLVKIVHDHMCEAKRSDHSHGEAVVLSSQFCRTTSSNSLVNHFYFVLGGGSFLLLSGKR